MRAGPAALYDIRVGRKVHYVGISYHPSTRWCAHKASDRFPANARMVVLCWYDDWLEARMHEYQRISRLKPPLNIDMNPDRTTVVSGGRSLSKMQATINGAKAKRGRKIKTYDPETLAAAKIVWDNRHIKRWQDVKKALPRGITMGACWRMWGGRNPT